jgi:hypothetical protein
MGISLSPMSPYRSPHFQSSQLKIERAGKHILEFEEYTAELFGKEFAPYMTTSFIDPESGEYVEKVFAVPEIKRLALICGDVIHNLKTALDYAWHDSTHADSIVPIHKNKFPVYPTREHLEQFIKSRKEQQSVVRLSDRLLNLIQPYKGGNTIGSLIYALHQLDIRDKHQLLIPQVQASHIIELDADDRTCEGVRAVYGTDIINTYGAKDKYQNQLSASIIFGEGSGSSVEGRPVKDVLSGFETAVNATLLILRVS